ncbi:Na(+)/H(+) antiporter subunit B [Halanaerobacter jeridensis]|uniref:Multicomponent Na+:H+ antiporter subunit B n=1 Tax=Halanaerobacter jeridensis TaxID=706427 RepID=A0A938XPI6_9FIRM|nr:hydrogenase subunit MbhD domain-containing protein [Halanaerobacter jeridensis]MBM7556647.1 multicomponent Na+:H+ antiporter subunit B [Halanaerobacter jeridensis]
MIEIILYILLLLTVVAALVVVFADNLVSSVIGLSIFSSSLVVIFVIFQAPDVALTEIVIGSGITTGLFIITIDKTGGGKE